MLAARQDPPGACGQCWHRELPRSGARQAKDDDGKYPWSEAVPQVPQPQHRNARQRKLSWGQRSWTALSRTWWWSPWWRLSRWRLQRRQRSPGWQVSRSRTRKFSDTAGMAEQRTTGERCKLNACGYREAARWRRLLDLPKYGPRECRLPDAPARLLWMWGAWTCEARLPQSTAQQARTLCQVSVHCDQTEPNKRRA